MTQGKQKGVLCHFEHMPTLRRQDKEALKELLQTRLVECGWHKDIREMIRNIIKERGVDNIDRDQLTAEIVPQARALVPEVIKNEIMMRVYAVLDNPFHP
ncbi:enhancer of yellow 2b transcription factor [Drosophila simulans]|uniref:Enhancer of yellow 2 transcription factor n=1 Tax=Drosophila simulans TaxID=7240 RepID=B4QZ00_DROSI|nr:enhancer of yellow 2b transcription factor [Drosophila simulans]EDX11940.1 GD19911 [Drosophila simulans]KMZ01945.1 uncharacterized protein Dsimw501_GD19911 [Drosophila simulans]